MTDTKPCLICGATITRTTQCATDWAKRAYCSHACAWVIRRAAKTDPADTKTCTVCGKAYQRPPHMARKRWAQRVACSTQCGDKIRTRPRQTPARHGRCEICQTALRGRRAVPTPWCSKPCKAAWIERHPDAELPAGHRPLQPKEPTEPEVRLRSDLLPPGTPRKTWVDRTPGHVAVCCGHCRRRFPRPTIRLAERLLVMHRRVCGTGL